MRSPWAFHVCDLLSEKSGKLLRSATRGLFPHRQKPFHSCHVEDRAETIVHMRPCAPAERSRLMTVPGIDSTALARRLASPQRVAFRICLYM